MTIRQWDPSENLDTPDRIEAWLATAANEDDPAYLARKHGSVRGGKGIRTVGNGQKREGAQCLSRALRSLFC